VNPAHLFLGTQAENVADMRTKKRHQHGERHGNAKLTEALIRDIACLTFTGATRSETALRVGISQHQVVDVVNGRAWRHMQGIFG